MTTQKSICIIGLGYIGLPTAAMFATHGFNVHGVDINNHIINTINQGKIHIEEPGLLDVVKNAINSGNLWVSNTVEPADIFIIAVPTPFKHNEYGEFEGKNYKLADMRAVISATESIVPHLGKGNLVVLESTSPPETTVELVKPILEKSNLRAGEDFYLIYSPERVLPGRILEELVGNARVIGGINNESAKYGKEIYESFVEGEIVLTTSTIAELVKLFENTYRDINIALANEFGLIASSFGIDSNCVIDIANLHPRVNILSPGIGVGGHCIAVDPWFIVEKRPDISKLILQARNINDSIPIIIAEKIRKIIKENHYTNITCFGFTYKANVDDYRESPAIEIINILLNDPINIKIFDPHVNERVFTEQVFSQDEAISTMDLAIILVGHKEFSSIYTLNKIKHSFVIFNPSNTLYD